MSVEALVVAGLVEAGSPKAAYQHSVNKHDFEIFTDEFEWLERRFESRKPVTRRVFQERFPEFEFVAPKEKIEDLLEELRTEKAYSQIASLVETVSETLLPENAIDTADHMREVLSDVLKSYSPNSDIDIKSFSDHFEQVKQHRTLAKAGTTVGMPSLIPTIDYHWDGLSPGRLIGVLGRPGEGKSFLISWFAWVAIYTGMNIGLFSPEMNEFEHRCRLHTLASANPEVQKACGLKKPFRNRDLMRGTNFSMKDYKRFLEYFETLPGNCMVFTKKYRKQALTPSYIASRVEDLGMRGVILDPISKISMGVRKRNDNPIWEAYDKVHAMQELGEEHNIFVVATNWSTRQQGKSKSEKAPDLDDSFGSDALAQECDHVIGVKHDPEDKTLTLRCSKSRFGKAKFTATIDFHPNTGHWQEVNVDSEVTQYRMAQNGNRTANGNEAIDDLMTRRALRRAKPTKAKPTKAKSKKAVA